MDCRCERRSITDERVILMLLESDDGMNSWEESVYWVIRVKVIKRTSIWSGGYILV